jgi:hypothetical protein
MKKIVINNNRKKVLVVSGCSHTQGCAITKTSTPVIVGNKETYELASTELKKLYNKDRVTTAFITDKFTWGGQLKKLLKYDEVYNLGFGGQGIEAVIRGIRNYSIKFDSLKNHTFVIQIPNPARKEILQRITSKDYSIEQLFPILEINSEDEFNFALPDPSVEVLADKLVDFDHIEINFMLELYFLQDYLEAKGANVRMILKPFNDWTIKSHSQWAAFINQYSDYNNSSYEKVATNFAPLEKIVNALNIIDTTEIVEIRKTLFKNKDEGTLHGEGLLRGDHHYSQKGNAALAKTIKRNLDNKTKDVFTLNGLHNVKIK